MSRPGRIGPKHAECEGMTPFIRLRPRLYHGIYLLPFATAFAGFGLAAPAGAQTTGEAPVADPCATVFTDATRTNRNLSMATSAPPGSDAQPGQEIRLEGSWNPAMWDSVSGLAACVELADRVDQNLGGVEEPPVNDGAFAHLFNIPAGLNNGTVICTRLRLTGDPAGAATTGEWVSKQACFEVHPDGPPPTTPPTTPATNPPAQTTTTTAPAAPPPPTTATTVARPPVTSPPAGPAGGVEPPAVPAQGTVAYSAPDAPDEPSVAAESPRPGPISLPILPETGAGASTGLLALAGIAALGSGLPLLIAYRRK